MESASFFLPMLRGDSAMAQARIEVLGYSKTWQISLSSYLPPLIYICPICQNIWARLRYEKFAPTQTAEMPCERCPPPTGWPYRQQNVPGSLIWRFVSPFEGDVYLDEVLIEALPPDLLQRELNLHIKAYQNEQYFTSSCSWYLPDSAQRDSFATIDTRTGVITPPRS